MHIELVFPFPSIFFYESEHSRPAADCSKRPNAENTTENQNKKELQMTLPYTRRERKGNVLREK